MLGNRKKRLYPSLKSEIFQFLTTTINFKIIALLSKSECEHVIRLIKYRDPFENQHLGIVLKVADHINWQCQRFKEYTRLFKITWV